MRAPDFSQYLALRPSFAVTGEMARDALAWAQPLALEALDIHSQRQTLVDGELPAYVVMTRPDSNGGWGELMPLWFKPYDRPVPLYCLDNWALFALLYRDAFGRQADLRTFNAPNLLRVVLGADLLIPFLPGTDGQGRFLRHGALPILLSILWLEPEAREAWLGMHACGGRQFAVEYEAAASADLGDLLERVESEAWLVPDRALVAGEDLVREFLADEARAGSYGALFGGLCLSVSALARALGTDWRRWVFQAINVSYRSPGFGLREIAAWLA